MNSNNNNFSNGTVTPDSGPWHTPFHITMVTLACVIVLVNTPVVFLYWKMSSLRFSAGNTFLVGLAVADLLSAIFMIPAGFLCNLNVLGSDENRQHACRFYFFSNYSISVASVYHIIAASIAKYLAILFPMKNITAFTKFRVKCMIIKIWVMAVFVGHVPVYWIFLEGAVEEKLFEIHGYVLLVLVFFIPTLILIYIHIHIYLHLFLRSRSRGTSLTIGKTIQGQNNRRIALLFVLLFIVFLTSWLPGSLIDVGWLSQNNEYFLILRFFAPVLNPLVFTFAKRDFRKAAAQVVVQGLRRKRLHRFSIRSSNNPTKMESSLDNCRTSTVDQNQSCTSSPPPSRRMKKLVRNWSDNLSKGVKLTKS